MMTCISEEVRERYCGIKHEYIMKDNAKLK